MSADLSGKVAMITGSGRGIGQAQALLMAERGADIVVHDVDPKLAESTADEIAKSGRRVHIAVADVRDLKGMATAVAAAEAVLGRIDILVNNAGVPGGDVPFEAIDEAAFDRMLGIHVKGAFFATRAVVPGMKARRYGRIINISSNRGIAGHYLSSHYSAAKAALIGLTRAWAKEFAAHNILVNAVAPGVVRTYMTTRNGMAPLREEADLNLLKRWAEPREIAYAVAYLASAEADFMTGQVLCPNGGEAG